MTMRIAVLTGGGDCPGLNGAIKWVTKTALDPLLEHKRTVTFDVLGIKEGWRGLVEVDPDDPRSLAQHVLPLDEEVVRTWDRYGGTNLGTSRTNPFNPKTRIDFALAEAGFVTLTVHDVLGREVTTLVREALTPGSYSVDFHAEALASGVYLCRLQQGGSARCIRMVLAK